MYENARWESKNATSFESFKCAKKRLKVSKIDLPTGRNKEEITYLKAYPDAIMTNLGEPPLWDSRKRNKQVPGKTIVKTEPPKTFSEARSS